MLLLIASVLLRADDDWIRVIRDAQVANQALLVSGSARVEVELKLATSDQPVRMISEIVWDGPSSRQKLRIEDPINYALRRPVEMPLDQQEWMYLWSNPREFVSYAPESSTLEIKKPEFYAALGMVRQEPLNAWFRCCPPNSAGGRPWTEMVGPLPGTDARVTFERVEGDRVRQKRFDADGGVSEIVFSMRDAGLPVESVYHPAKGGQGRGQRTVYRWNHVGDAVALAECTAEIAKPGDESSIAVRFHSRVSNVTLGAVAASELSYTHFLKSLPPETKIVDRAARTRRVLGRVEGIPQSELKRLSDLLRSRGFSRVGK
jgi:hypothetical protein